MAAGDDLERAGVGVDQDQDAARRTLRDSQVELAVVQMQSLFAEGDLVGGLRRGIQMLAEHARAPQTLHAEPKS